MVLMVRKMIARTIPRAARVLIMIRFALLMPTSTDCSVGPCTGMIEPERRGRGRIDEQNGYGATSENINMYHVKNMKQDPFMGFIGGKLWQHVIIAQDTAPLIEAYHMVLKKIKHMPNQKDLF